MSEQNKYYVYVYCNPLKPGIYSYQENGIGIDFPCAPFYIGKGCDLRFKGHLKEARKYLELIESETIEEEIPKYNTYKINTINKIQRLGEEVVIFKICENLEEDTAFILERFFIKLVGRANKNKGPLTNMTDGGDGFRGRLRTPEEIEKRIISFRKTIKENPHIMHDANVKGWETRDKDSNYRENFSKKISESKFNRPEEDKELTIQRYKDKLESNPSINIKRGENISRAWDNKSEEEKLARNKKLSVGRIENKVGIGSNYYNFYKLDHEILIKSYFAGICKKDIIEDYNKVVERPLNPQTYNRLLFVLNLPINTLAKGHPYKREIYLEFIKENKHKVEWYIENYERLEEEYFENIHKEKHKEFFATNNNIEVEHE